MLHHCSSKLLTKVLDFGAIRSLQALQYNKWAYRLKQTGGSWWAPWIYIVGDRVSNCFFYSVFIGLKKNVNWLLSNRLFAKQHNMERKGRPEEKSPKSINQTNIVPTSLKPTTPHYDQQYCNFPRTGTFSWLTLFLDT